jgi:hypothetical protein
MFAALLNKGIQVPQEDLQRILPLQVRHWCCNAEEIALSIAADPLPFYREKGMSLRLREGSIYGINF